MDLAGYTLQDVLYAFDGTVVARARDANGHPVVLKYLDTPRPRPEQVGRWQHEHAVLAAIDSPWVVKTLGLSLSERGPVLVLEDFGTANLAQWLQQHPLDIGERLALAEQLAAALSAVHAHGLVHGDLSPRNVLVDGPRLRLKLCDFGLASRLGRERRSPQEAGARGTLEYLSPEQTGRTNLEVDYRSDFYSLGVILYELFAGQRPFASADPMALLHAQIAVMPPPLADVDPAIPAVLSELVQKLLSKVPDERYQSSFGLLADLRRIHHHWQRSRHVPAFVLAQEDVPERFCVSQRIYGRGPECTTLLAAFDRACRGEAELLLVGGYSGVGKTAVIGELHRPVVARRGFFVRGKCDQYSRNQPYAALVQAFQQLIRQLAAESLERRAYWRLRLGEALGEGAGAVVDVLPELRLLIGEPPPLPPLPAAENEGRFHIAFGRFVDALAARNHPLMLFLDDLQWADASTLRLVEHLVRDEGERSLLVVGAFRDNEVDATHPLAPLLAASRQPATRMGLLRIGHLELAHVRQLVADTLHTDEASVSALAELCFAKTQGNPFFLGQLLRSLHDSGDIRYERDRGEWHWDLARIEQRGITDNVVALMLQKLRSLSAETQTVLALAAQLGASFDLRQLAAVQGVEAASAIAALWPALQAGLVLPLDENYKFTGSPENLQAARFRFQHDRVQQAAHDLTPPELRPELQLRCGRQLLANSSEAEIEDRLFTILDALNGAVALITDADERARLCALNLRGGLRAKAASALPMAVSLLRAAQALLEPDAWRVAPQRTLAITAALAEAEYLSGDFAAAEARYAGAVAAAPDVASKVTLLLVQADQFHIQGRFGEAYPVLCEALALLGRPFPKDDAEAMALFPGEFAETEALLESQGLDRLLDAPEMTDAHTLLAMRAAFGLAYASYQIGAQGAYVLNACRMVQATLRHGQCDLSAIAYVTFVTAMAAMKRPYPACHALGKRAMAMADQRDSAYFRLSVYQYFAAFYQHWGEPLAEGLRYLDAGEALGQSGINPLAAGYCVLLRANSRFIQGTPLDALQEECERSLRFLRQSHQGATEAMLTYGILLPLLALRGRTLSPTSFDTPELRCSTFFADGFATPSIPLAFHIASVARHAYLMGDASAWRQCEAHLGHVALCLPDGPSMVEARFYIALGLLREEFHPASTLPDRRAEAETHLAAFRTWAEGCPANFLHKALLLEAELARVAGEDARAMDLYAQAIDAAARAGFLACEALANERYAVYWRDRGQKHLSGNFARDAWYHFRRWGAEVKCRQLEAAWPGVAFRLLDRSAEGSLPSTAGSQSGGPERDDLPDVHALFKTTQFLASEVQLEALLPKWLQVMLENAGAEQGALLLVDDDEQGSGALVVEVAGRLGHGGQFDGRTIGRPLADWAEGEPPRLPAPLIEYVQLTRSTLLLNDPATDDRFATSTYLQQHRPKSVLCLPVMRQGKLVGVVYLENRLLENAFTRRHCQTLELLGGQAAVSLVNARLYESLERKVRARTEELRQMSMRDGLTGIANRRAFDERLALELRRAQREASPLALLMVDIDHFKPFNDACGHVEGDECIRAVAHALARAAQRPGDLVARYGGEEFALLLPMADADTALRVAKACRDVVAALALPHPASPTSPHITLSVGACVLRPGESADAAALITRADQALYRAKREGRNRLCLDDGATAESG